MVEDSVSFWADIQRYEDMLAADPRSYCFATLSELYRKLGLLDDAISVAQKGCDRHPDYQRGFIALGNACYDKGLYGEARTALERAVVLDPEDLLAQKLLGQLYVEAGEVDLAKKVLGRVLQQNPDDTESMLLLRSVSSAEGASGHDPEDAVENLEVVEELEIVEDELEVIEDRPEVVEEGLAAVEDRPEVVQEELAVVEDDLELAEEDLEEAEVIEELTEVVDESYLSVAGDTSADFGAGKEMEPEPLEMFAEPEPVERFAEPEEPPVARLHEEPEELDAFRAFEEIEELEPLVPSAAAAPPATSDAGNVTPSVRPPARDPLATATLAELYVSQGYVDKALRIYRELLSADPANPILSTRCGELEKVLNGQIEVQEPAAVVAEVAVPSAQAAKSEIPAVKAEVPASPGGLEAELSNWLENIRRRKDGV